MIEIKDVLINFEHLLQKGEMRKGIIVDVFKQTLNLDLATKDIDIKNGVLYLNIKPIYKNEILMKKEKINLALEKALGKKSPQNIR